MQSRPQPEIRRRSHPLSFVLLGITLVCTALLVSGLHPTPAPSSAAAPPDRSASQVLPPNQPRTDEILVTEQGFVPAIFTTTVGIPVTWLNASESMHLLRSGTPQRIYLPQVSRAGEADSSASRSGDLPAADLLTGNGEYPFAATLWPGMSFTFTFTTTGSFPFYLANAPEFTGKVVVLPVASPPPDPAEVAPPLDPTTGTSLRDATDFLYTGDNPIQTGVVAGTIATLRAAVLRGGVTSGDGEPLPAVRITVLGHPEFGQTRSRADGFFDMAVNGGGQLTLRYEKEGFLPAQRAVDAPWRDYAWLPEVTLLPYDSAVTQIDLGAAEMQVAQGSEVSDSDGNRQATIFFPPNTTARQILRGGRSAPLSTLSVRVTEFTVGAGGPDAMPAQLPPSSGYTYAAEFSVDEAVAAGAVDVQFSQPLPVFVENFLGFPVGGAVPAGYYDREKGQWVASANGRVIAILSITSGLADLDIDGSGNPANADALTALGVTSAERSHLAQLYTPGQTLWRVPVSHFTPWDFNWSNGPPNGAKPPPGNQNNHHKPKKPNTRCGSVIGCEDQTLGESLSIAGTPWRLHYKSDRTPGRVENSTLVIPVSGPTIPDSLQAMRVEVDIAGRLYQQTFAPASNRVYTVTWDGKDGYGRFLSGAQTAVIRVHFDYAPQYYAAASDFENSFARAEAAGPGVVVSRQAATITLSKTWTKVLSSRVLPALGLGGWSLSIHHVYVPAEPTIFLGNGSQRGAEAQTLNGIFTVAGNGDDRYSGDGGPATAAGMVPWDVALSPDGSLYIADGFNRRIRRVGTDGIITTLTDSDNPFADPTALAFGPDGSLYFADGRNCRIRRMGPDGIVTTFAGTGGCGFGGDGGLAVAARLDNIVPGLAIGPDGSLYFAEYRHNRIRRVGTDGIISTVAGNGAFCCVTDGAPATTAGLFGPSDVAVGQDGSLYIADTAASRVHRVGIDGTIQTVAGSRAQCCLGNGGPAVAAALDRPVSVAVGRDGYLYIADTGMMRVLRVGPNGIIITVAGIGCCHVDGGGDGGPGTAARLWHPRGIVVGPDGSLYIADLGNSRVRSVRPTWPDLDVTDILLPSEDGTELYIFDKNGRHLKTLDALTGALRYQFAYDSAGYLISVTDGDSNLTTFERNGATPTAIVAPSGQRTTLGVNSDGWLSSLSNPAGETHTMSYSTDGLLQQFVDPRANIHRFTYDGLGRLVKDEDPAGGSVTLSRVETSSGYTVTTTSALGHSRLYSVEKLPTEAIRSSVTEPSGKKTVTLINTDGSHQFAYATGTVGTYRYGPDPRWGMLAAVESSETLTTTGGRIRTLSTQRTATFRYASDLLSLIAMTDTISENGAASTLVYDSASRTLTALTPGGRMQTEQFTPAGKVAMRQAAPSVSPLLFSYDTAGRLTQLTQSALTLTFTRDSQGQVVQVTDGSGSGLHLSYDAASRPVTLTLKSGRTYGYTYDKAGNRVQVAMPSGAKHGMTYTPLNLLGSYTVPGGGSYAVNYAADGKLAAVTMPSGASLNYLSDGFGRPAGLSLPDAKITISYGSGYHIAAIDRGPLVGAPTQGISLVRDGALLTGMNVTGMGAGHYTYTYNNDFRLTAMSLSSGSDTLATTYQRDVDGLVIGYGPFTIARNGPAGAASAISDGALALAITFDGRGRITGRTFSVAGQPAAALSVGFDAHNRVISRTLTLAGETQARTYAYDVDGQLLSVSYNGVEQERYAYDANGNRSSRHTVGIPTQIATYDAADRMLTQGGVQSQFNADGYLTQRGNDTFQYSVRGELQKAVVGGKNISYRYDGLGRRVSRSDEAGLTQYLYAGPSALLPGAVREPDGSLTHYYFDDLGLLFSVQKGGNRYYVVTDSVGTPLALVDSSGAVVKAVSYDSYGVLLADSNPSLSLAIGFGGGLADRLTGLVRLGVRDYDPIAGRWTALDPALFEGDSLNLYAYVGNSPVSLRDPIGLASVGANGYLGVGGGFRFAIDGNGLSFCAEAGFGIGVDADLSPTGGINKDFGGRTFEVNGQLLGFGYGIERNVPAELIDPCIDWSKAKDTWKIRVPFMGMNLDDGDPTAKGLDLKGLQTGAEVKVAHKECISHLW